eukprot:superscaffoldBa00004461_g18917
MMEVVSYSGSDAPLQCTARYKPGVQYRAVRWYKVGEPPSPRLSGLLTKDLPNGTTRWYLGLDREVELLDETRNILLPNVTCSDSGVYMCRLEAPVGEQNQEGQILLILAVRADSNEAGKHGKDNDGQRKHSAAKPEKPISSITEDIDALLEELLEEDYSDSTKPKTEHFPKGPQVEKKLSSQSGGRKCCPVFVGGSSVTNGVGTATSKRSCDQLRCTSCDFRVLMFDDCEWDPSCDYLFL